MLQVESIAKKFGKKEALHETSFTLDKGIVGLLGPNGAGKTTLLRILSTYYAPDRGSIRMNQLDWKKDTEKVRRIVGYLPQHIGGFPNLKAREYLEYMGVLRGLDTRQLSKEIPLILQEVNLEQHAEDLVKSFSGGMKQRLGIAQAILHHPALLLVDEPTAGLDPEERIRFRNLIKKLGQDRIVILSTHITEDVAMTCDQVLLMQGGTIQPYPSIEEVVSLAKGKVWELTTDVSTAEQIQTNPAALMTQHLQLDSSQLRLRYIAPDPLDSKATAASPTLEEGYMVWLNKR
ncbi:ABC-type multidrug transport system, ATPase component [Paenibacillus barengoltzii]|uniref:ABC transporter ATP-binding protein n=1 Tax=Paenibacillus barengoltzii TaxID=343517 RepID=UPI000A08ABFE|nr:ABC transporter ATP-binding protein [Paenibacillus barengoltzii]SMF61008.1 ABC-type multidrug transport system, ATPase component [Paenibacillus barengoltzii]